LEHDGSAENRLDAIVAGTTMTFGVGVDFVDDVACTVALDEAGGVNCAALSSWTGKWFIAGSVWAGYRVAGRDSHAVVSAVEV